MNKGRIYGFLAAAVFLSFGAQLFFSGPAPGADPLVKTTTPIKRLVVIFQENVSFDHYFATYPKAANPPGEPAFKPLPGTPSINGLTGPLIAANPNSARPFRLGRNEAVTCDQNHEYTAEQKAYNAGLVDRFVEFAGATYSDCDPRVVMGYFDGNTVTALWNYAQRFAMSDNFYASTFGPSTPGALNLVSGQTHGATPSALEYRGEPVVVEGTVVGDPQPKFDDCSKRETVEMSGRNIGNLLNDGGVTWGWFSAGFRPTGRSGSGRAVCASTHAGSDGRPKGDYIPHHEPFQYYESTANARHLAPESAATVGKNDRANHQYDLEDFWDAARINNIPAVSFLKAPAYRDGHAGYSDPLAEQVFIVSTVNRLQGLKEWKEMAVVIAYDDSDGWYDHVMPPIVNRSNVPSADALTGPGSCGGPPKDGYQGRCGLGPRLPLIIVSPFSKTNFVDHSVTDQTSILRFIEENWSLGTIGNGSFDAAAGSLDNMFDFSSKKPGRALILDETTGEPVKQR